jgi:hypothetical protein
VAVSACPGCGRENPSDAKFCSECGTGLAAVPAGAREERKIISVLFVDLAGFTARFVALGALPSTAATVAPRELATKPRACGR